MTSLLKNVDGQTLPFSLISSTDGEAPVVAGTASVFVKVDQGVMQAGTGAVGAQDAGGGGHYIPTQAETNGEALAFRVTLAGAITERFTIYTDKPATVYFDQGAAAGGSGLYNSPINNATDALQRMADWGARHLVILGGGFTVPATTGDISGLLIEGSGLDTKLSLNNRPALDTTARNLVVDGQLASGELILEGCLMDGILDFLGYARECLVNGTITVAANGPGFFHNCGPQYANAPPIINYQGLAINAAGITGWVGPVRVDGIGVASFVTTINLQGVLTFEAGCTNNSAAVTVTGQGDIVDNSGANFTFNRSQFLTVIGGNAYADQQAWIGVAPLALTAGQLVQTEAQNMRGTDGVDTAPMRGTDGVDTAPMRGTDGASTHGPADVWGPGAPTRQLTSPQNYDNTGQTTSLPTTVSGTVDASVVQLNGNAGAAAKLEESYKAVVTFVCDTGGSTTSVVFQTTNPAFTVNDQPNGKIITFADDTTTPSLRGQSTDISNYDNGTRTATVTALTTAPASGDTGVIT